VAKFIPDDILDRVRQATDIASLIRAVVPLRKSGSGLVGLCPFHKEKTPSFHVNPDRQIFKCFGCGAGGDVFTFLQKTEGVSFPEAIQMLAERANITLPEQFGEERAPGERARLFEMNAFAARLYASYLREPAGQAAREYIQQRGLTPEMIKAFGLGYAPGGWDVLMSAARKAGYEASLLLKGGLVAANEKSDRVYDRFRDRLMFPIRDTQDRVIGFGARSLDGSEPKYLNSPETPVFSKGRTLFAIDRAKQAMRESRRAIVVEGYMDAVMLHQFGFDNTVAVLGTALSRDHVRLLRRYVEETILLFDGDSAGQSSANRSLDAFIQEELPARVVLLPDEMDPDDFVRKQGKDALGRKLDEASDPVAFKLNRAIGNSGRAPDARALDDVLAMIALMPNSVARQQALRELAGRTGVPDFRLEERMNSLAAGSGVRRETDSGDRSKDARKRHPEYELLHALLTYPSAIPVAKQDLRLQYVNDKKLNALLQRTFDLAESGIEVDAAALLARTPEEPLRGVLEGLIGDDVVHAEEPAAWCRELIGEIEARTHDVAAQDAHRRLSAPSTRGNDDTELMERLQRARDAQRARGNLDIKKTQ
jgi:DNA primase